MVTIFVQVWVGIINRALKSIKQFVILPLAQESREEYVDKVINVIIN